MRLLSRRRSDDVALEFATAVVVGLSDRPRWLPARFLYDEQGSGLFERICETPEYYLTRTEAAILQASASALRELTGPVALVELGSGNSTKTSHLLTAYASGPRPTHYIPVDVSTSALRAATRAIALSHPRVRVESIQGAYQTAFPLLSMLSPVMLVFLGSTIGNLNQTEASQFWSDVSRHLNPGDFVLLGVDLVKDTYLLNAAYSDAAGLSAAFTKNIFARMNRDLGASIDLSQIHHEARYDEEWRRIEIYARFHADQTIHVRPLERTVRVKAGERIMTEISRKFALDDLEEYLTCFGLHVRHTFTDANRWYGVLLLQRSAGASRTDGTATMLGAPKNGNRVGRITLP